MIPLWPTYPLQPTKSTNCWPNTTTGRNIYSKAKPFHSQGFRPNTCMQWHFTQYQHAIAYMPLGHFKLVALPSAAGFLTGLKSPLQQFKGKDHLEQIPIQYNSEFPVLRLRQVLRYGQTEPASFGTPRHVSPDKTLRKFIRIDV